MLSINEDDLVEGNESLELQLLRPLGSLYLGGERIMTAPALGRGLSSVSVVDNDFHHGVLRLGREEYAVDEHAKTLCPSRSSACRAIPARWPSCTRLSQDH